MAVNDDWIKFFQTLNNFGVGKPVLDTIFQKIAEANQLPPTSPNPGAVRPLMQGAMQRANRQNTFNAAVQGYKGNQRPRYPMPRPQVPPPPRPVPTRPAPTQNRLPPAPPPVTQINTKPTGKFDIPRPPVPKIGGK